MILFVDACARRESRTRLLSDALLSRLGGSAVTLRLYDEALPLIGEAEADDRVSAASAGDFRNPLCRYARQLADADEIVIAAPFWDMSFPAVLKRYIEAVCVNGITFTYSEEGIPVGLCRAKRLYYVTTAGGPIFDRTFGYGYVKALAENMFGIKECFFISAENLDIIGADVSAIMQRSIDGINEKFTVK